MLGTLTATLFSQEKSAYQGFIPSGLSPPSPIYLPSAGCSLLYVFGGRHVSFFYLLVRLNLRLAVSYLIKTSGRGSPGSASMSCPNMADSAVALGVCITHSGAAGPVSISPALQHAYFGAACHPIGFSSLRPTSCALFPLLTTFRHTCTKHTMVSGNWGGNGSRSHKEGTHTDLSLHRTHSGRNEISGPSPCPTGKQVPKDRQNYGKN